MFHIKGELNTLFDLTSRVQKINIASCVNLIKSLNSSKLKYENSNEARIDFLLETAHFIGHFGAIVMYNHITVTLEEKNIPKLVEWCI